jgi:hypothetical protein
MTRDELFEAWAPPGGTWSNWAKPALFAQLPPVLPTDTEPAAYDLSWVSRPDQRVAIVVDLPGAASVHFGLALASLGYQPVPLFNACLPPGHAAATDPAGENAAVVRLEPIVAALVRGADQLRASPPPAGAPPVFLIDADREATHRPVAPDAFDNRSVVFVTDFPSAATLSAHGITRALVVRQQLGAIGADLGYALQVWQKAGVWLEARSLSEPGPPAPLALPRPRWWTGLWRRLRGAFGFHRNAAGEFGGFIPHPSAG